MPESPVFFTQFRPRLQHGVVEFPVHHLRGGTSTGLVIWQPFAPATLDLKEELLRHLMGVPLQGRQERNKQTTGLGRGGPTSNKVFFADVETAADGSQTIVSTLAQLAHNHAGIDWSVNCGNMSSALQLWALDAGLLNVDQPGQSEVRIRNTNTGIVTVSRMERRQDGSFLTADIPGVDGAYPAVDLFLQSPVGGKNGHLLPTGAVVDVIDGYQVSCVDVAVPMVICDASEFGKTGQESIPELDADPQFKAALRKIWVEAGLRMRLKRRDGNLMSATELEHSETIPKICIVSKPVAGGNLSARYFTPQTGHGSLAVSGGCCLAAAALIPGTVAHRLTQDFSAVGPQYGEVHVGLENPAGILEATVVARTGTGADVLDIQSAAYRRSTQIVLRGHVPLYRASPALRHALLAS